jgi:vancomycin resistance protein YoaR
MSARRSRPERNRGSIYLGLAAGLFAASGAMVGGYVFTSGPQDLVPAKPAEVAPGTSAASGSDALAAAVTEQLEQSVTIKVGEQLRSVRWSELGVTVDASELPHAARKAEAEGAAAIAPLTARGALPVALDRARTLEAIAHLKATIDRAPVNAHLDLEARAIHDDRPGFAIDVYAALDRIDAAARTGAKEIELPVVEMPAQTTRASLAIDDISHVLGTWTTRFPVGDKDRNFNLKLAASHLNGFVMQPGVEFSFNDVVGDRTEKEGYKIAHVITAGEMVDGLAGGTCQISTTLFGASFFAGLEIVKTTNHSRPSTYVTMGLDATVVYPTTDLKMKNPYDFPVVIHYRVARGEAVVEILGKERPWDEVAFEREILEELPFESEEREEPKWPLGFSAPDQLGFNGYTLTRFRKFYKDGKHVKTDKWKVVYKPVTEYLRKGTNPDPLLAPPEVKEPHGPKAPGEGRGRIVQ